MAIGDKIYIADKPTLDVVNAKTGTTTDTGGTTTAGGIFAKLNAILQQFLSNWTVARAGRLDNLDATVSSRTSKSDMGKIVDSGGNVFVPELRSSGSTGNTIQWNWPFSETPESLYNFQYHEGKIYIPVFDNSSKIRIHVFNADSLSYIGSTSEEKQVKNNFCVQANKIFASAQGGGIHIFDADTLAYIKSINTVGNMEYLTAKNNIAYGIDSSAKKIIALNTDTLVKVAESSSYSTYAQALTILGNQVFYFDYDKKKIIGLDASNLAKISESTTNVETTSMIAGEEYLYCINKTDLRPTKFGIFGSNIQPIATGQVQTNYTNALELWNGKFLTVDEINRRVMMYSDVDLQSVGYLELPVSNYMLAKNNSLFYTNSSNQLAKTILYSNLFQLIGYVKEGEQ